MLELQNSVSDADMAFRANQLKRATRDHVVEFCLVRALGKFEEYLGELFCLAMEGKLGAECAPTMAVTSHDDALLLVSGFDDSSSGRYTAWMPFAEKTLKRADKLFANGLPFARLAHRPTEKAALSELVIVRNAIAHDSSVARGKFEALARSKGYPSTRSADYLTSMRGPAIEIVLGLARLEAIARGLAAESDSDSRVFLEPEDPFEPTWVAPPGAYQCKRNGHSAALANHSTLGECRDCPRPVSCPHCGKREKTTTAWVRAI